MRQEQAKGSDEVGATNYYQQKYKHILGGLECAKESAVKMEPNKKFGYGKTPGRDGTLDTSLHFLHSPGHSKN